MHGIRCDVRGHCIHPRQLGPLGVEHWTISFLSDQTELSGLVAQGFTFRDHLNLVAERETFAALAALLSPAVGLNCTRWTYRAQKRLLISPYKVLTKT